VALFICGENPTMKSLSEFLEGYCIERIRTALDGLQAGRPQQSDTGLADDIYDFLLKKVSGYNDKLALIKLKISPFKMMLPYVKSLDILIAKISSVSINNDISNFFTGFNGFIFSMRLIIDSIETYDERDELFVFIKKLLCWL
jgi:hypothetical protein